MKILFIALPESIHTARWINQIAGCGWEIHLASSTECRTVHPEMRNVIFHVPFYTKGHNKNVKYAGIHVFFPLLDWLFLRISAKIPARREAYVRRLIKRIKPDIVHTLETQHAGYLVLGLYQSFGGNFPKWVHTNWGSDIYLFGRLAGHREKIRELLRTCDFYSCECLRDLILAKEIGLRGHALPIYPNAGGFNLERLKERRERIKPSHRRCIMLKGYQGWCGRSLTGLRALTLAKDALQGYRVILYSADQDDVRISAELFGLDTGVPVTFLPIDTAHDTILNYHAESRISLGLSISDAISTSMLEALVMGSFPIQSNTAAVDEWFVHGKTGFSVPPEDPEAIAPFIRRALTDDALVDSAAEKNWTTAVEKLDYRELRKKTIDSYKFIYDYCQGCTIIKSGLKAGESELLI